MEEPKYEFSPFLLSEIAWSRELSSVKVRPTPPSQSMTSVLKYRHERSTGSIHKAEADFSRGQADCGRVREQRSNES